MILHDFDEIAVNKDLHLEEALSNMQVIPEKDDYMDSINSFYVETIIDDEDVKKEIFDRALGHIFESGNPVEVKRENLTGKIEYNVELPDYNGNDETVGFGVYAYADVCGETYKFSGLANLSDNEKEIMLKRILEQVPEAKKHIEKQLALINARSAEKGNSSPKKTQWDYGY